MKDNSCNIVCDKYNAISALYAVLCIYWHLNVFHAQQEILT